MALCRVVHSRVCVRAYTHACAVACMHMCVAASTHPFALLWLKHHRVAPTRKLAGTLRATGSVIFSELWKRNLRSHVEEIIFHLLGPSGYNSMDGYKIHAGISGQRTLERMRQHPSSTHTACEHFSRPFVYISCWGNVLSHGEQKGLEEKKCVFRCLSSCVKNILACGSQLFAKVQDPYVYLTVPPRPLLLWGSRPQRVSLAGLQAG